MPPFELRKGGRRKEREKRRKEGREGRRGEGSEMDAPFQISKYATAS